MITKTPREALATRIVPAAVRKDNFPRVKEPQVIFIRPYARVARTTHKRQDDNRRQQHGRAPTLSSPNPPHNLILAIIAPATLDQSRCANRP
jgi:hypothetical protein